MLLFHLVQMHVLSIMANALHHYSQLSEQCLFKQTPRAEEANMTEMSSKV